MTNVVVEHCTLRVVRRGGWRWGAEPRRVVEAATRALPELLAAELGEFFGDGDVSGSIRDRVRVSLSLSLAELRALAAHGGAAGEQAGESARQRVEAALGAALRRALPLPAPVRRCPGSATMPEDASTLPAADAEYWEGTVAATLANWQARGELRPLIGRFSLDTLVDWDAELSRPRLARELAFEAPSSTELSEFVRQVCGDAPIETESSVAVAHAESARRRRLEARLLAMAAIVARFHVPPWHAHVQATLERHWPRSDGTANDSRPHASDASARSGATEQRSAVPASESTARPLARTPRLEVKAALALPFLLLLPLAELGWLAAARAVLDATPELLPALAAAFAFKVTEPPERGWRRSQRTLLTAAAFAGEESVNEARLARLAEHAERLCSPLGAVLERAVVAGHTPGMPLAVERAANDDTLVLVDAEGVFPLACSPSPSELLAAAEPLASEVVLVSAHAASNTLFREFERRGMSFLTDARPARGEVWRLVEGAPGVRLHSNDTRRSDAALLALGARMRDVAEDVRLVWRSLADERPALLRGPRALDHSLNLAAGVALGYVAWTLWNRREPPHPELTLARFADLEARVTFEADTVWVRLPLGARHADLLNHGLLDDVDGVPWLDGRRVRFGGG